MKASNHPLEFTRAAVDRADALLLVDGERWPLVLEKFLGRSALQRNLLQLAQHGAKHCVIAVSDPQQLDALARAAERQLREIDAKGMSWRWVAQAAPETTTADAWADNVVCVNGAGVYDDRLFDAVFASAAPSALVSGSGGEALGLFKLRTDDVCRVLRGDAEEAGVCIAKLPGLRAVGTDGVPRYVQSMRRHSPPYWQALRNTADLKAAADKVMGAAQKGVLDFPARYLHPLPENYLTRLAAGMPITPNQITVFSAALAFVGTYLFATQSYAFALTMAVVAGILDGVDGKLARVKMLSSPSGDRLDHTLDISFEFSWYLAIAWGLSRSHEDPSLLGLGFLMIGLMLAARALSGSYLYLTGYQIHDHTAYDRTVRLLAGRRNIYVLVLLTGYLLGDFLSSFYVVIAWGLATVSLYLLRNAVAIMQKYAKLQTP